MPIDKLKVTNKKTFNSLGEGTETIHKLVICVVC